MKNLILFLTLLFIFPVVSQAGSFGSSAKGTTAANFLKIGVGARAVAMGEAYSAIADEVTALYWNPAAMRQIKRNSATLQHASHLEASKFNYGAFAHSGEKSSVGISVQHLSAGSLTGRDETGLEIAGFEPNDLAVSFGYARDLGQMAFGLSAKYIQSEILQTARTGALDVGLLSPRFYREKIRLSFTALNIGGKIEFNNESEDLPLVFKLGSGFEATKNWLIGADIGFPRDNDPYGALGTEFKFPIGGENALAARAGYNTKTSGDVDGFSGASFGAGITLSVVSLDYGFFPFGDIGSTHRISVTFNF